MACKVKIQSDETLTNIKDNGDGTFTYTNEDGQDVTINMCNCPYDECGETCGGVYDGGDDVSQFLEACSTDGKLGVKAPATKTGGRDLTAICQAFSETISPGQTSSCLETEEYVFTNETCLPVLFHFSLDYSWGISISNDSEGSAIHQVSVDGAPFTTVGISGLSNLANGGANVWSDNAGYEINQVVAPGADIRFTIKMCVESRAGLSGDVTFIGGCVASRIHWYNI